MRFFFSRGIKATIRRADPSLSWNDKRENRAILRKSRFIMTIILPRVSYSVLREHRYRKKEGNKDHRKNCHHFVIDGVGFLATRARAGGR